MPSKTVPIYADDDSERLYELRVAVSIAERTLAEERLRPSSTANARGGDVVADAVAEAEAALKAARDAYDAAVNEAAGRAEAWELRSIGFEAWDELLLKYPPRKVTEGEGEEKKEVDHPEDADFGVDTSRFGKALLLFADAEDPEHRTVVKIGEEPAGPILAKRLKRLARGQFDTLWSIAFHLNTGGITDPKVSLYSTAPRSTES